MSRKRIQAFFFAVLLAILASIALPLPSAPTVARAAECDITASGCD